MLDRRKFLKHAAGAAIVLSAESRFGTAALMAQAATGTTYEQELA